MKKAKYLLVSVIFFLGAVSVSADSAVKIYYGTITDVQVINKDAKHAGGALAGGAMAALLAGPRHKGLKVATSAAAGAAIQGAATSGTLQQYTVKLLDGGEVKVSTEQDEIRLGDCVAVERGDHVNIRRVSNIHCEAEAKPENTPEHHQAAANNCQKAKNELIAAQTDDEVNLAVQKVRILCED